MPESTHLISSCTLFDKFSQALWTLLRPNWSFSKHILFWVPSARHQITGLVWKSSDMGQQMHRKCFWSNTVSRERVGLRGGGGAWLSVHVCLRTSVRLCVSVRVDECWVCEAFFGTTGRFPTTETDVGTNPSVSGSSLSLRVLVPYVTARAARRRVVCDVILFSETLWDENMFFMNRKEG